MVNRSSSGMRAPTSDLLDLNAYYWSFAGTERAPVPTKRCFFVVTVDASAGCGV